MLMATIFLVAKATLEIAESESVSESGRQAVSQQHFSIVMKT